MNEEQHQPESFRTSPADRDFEDNLRAMAPTRPTQDWEQIEAELHARLNAPQPSQVQSETAHENPLQRSASATRWSHLVASAIGLAAGIFLMLGIQALSSIGSSGTDLLVNQSVPSDTSVADVAQSTKIDENQKSGADAVVSSSSLATLPTRGAQRNRMALLSRSLDGAPRETPLAVGDHLVAIRTDSSNYMKYSNSDDANASELQGLTPEPDSSPITSALLMQEILSEGGLL